MNVTFEKAQLDYIRERADHSRLSAASIVRELIGEAIDARDRAQRAEDVLGFASAEDNSDRTRSGVRRRAPSSKEKHARGSHRKAIGRVAEIGAAGRRAMRPVNMTLRLDQLFRVFDLADRDGMTAEEVVRDLFDEAFAARRFVEGTLAAREASRLERRARRDANPLPDLRPVLTPIEDRRSTGTRAMQPHQGRKKR